MYSSVLLPVFYTDDRVLLISIVESVLLQKEENSKKCKERAHFGDTVIASRDKKHWLKLVTAKIALPIAFRAAWSTNFLSSPL